ncbi:MAG TPA: hypothetical protein VGL56_20945 [Fimbriimonadaceae bacterium]|jgi:hypothetical protein
MTTFDFNSRELDRDALEQHLAVRGYIAIFWHIVDVKEVRPDLTDLQCWLVLQRCESHHDAGIGLDLDMIELHAEELFPKREREQP